MKKIVLRQGMSVLVGAPAVPTPLLQRETIKKAIRLVKGIQEAHLPQMYAKGAIDPPEQVLVLVFDVAVDQRALKDVESQLAKTLPNSESIAILPLIHGSQLLKDIQNTNCLLCPAGGGDESKSVERPEK